MKIRVSDQINPSLVVVVTRRIIAVLLAMSFLYVAYFVLLSGFIPIRYLVFAGILTGLIVTTLTVLLWRRRLSRVATIIVMGLALLSLVGGYAAFGALRAMEGFLGATTVSSLSHYETYEVLSLEGVESSYYESKDLNEVMSISSADKYVDLVKKELSDDSWRDVREVGSATELVEALRSGEANLVSINSSHLEAIKEYIPGLDDEVRTIHSFKVRVDSSAGLSDVTTEKPFVLYVSGVDTYGSINASSRSDVNMLVLINPKTHHILLVNTPRDYYVDLPAVGGVKDKLTHAGLYGVESSVAAIENLYGITVDRHLKVNFTTLVSVVDAIDGITVKSDYAFKSFKVGDNYLNGKQALEFSRERYEFSDGDRQRGRNQQRVIEAIISKLGDPKILLSYKDVLMSLQSSMQTNLEPELIRQVVNQQLDTMRPWSVESVSVDGRGGYDSTYSMGPTLLYVMYPDDNSIYVAKDAIARALDL